MLLTNLNICKAFLQLFYFYNYLVFQTFERCSMFILTIWYFLCSIVNKMWVHKIWKSLDSFFFAFYNYLRLQLLHLFKYYIPYISCIAYKNKNTNSLNASYTISFYTAVKIVTTVIPDVSSTRTYQNTNTTHLTTGIDTTEPTKLSTGINIFINPYSYE